MEDDYAEIARHIAPWFDYEIAKHLKMNRSIALRYLLNAITNITQLGAYQVSSGPYEEITVKEWHEAFHQLGFEEMVKQKYWILAKEFTPVDCEDKLAEFVSILSEAIAEVYDGFNWIYEMDELYGNLGFSLSEWIDLKKPLFKRTFWRLWKRFKSENKHSREILLSNLQI